MISQLQPSICDLYLLNVTSSQSLGKSKEGQSKEVNMNL